MAVLFTAVFIGSAAFAALIGFISYLAFCAFVVVRTGSTAGLRDVAIAIRAFASIGNLGSRSRLGGPRPLPPPAELHQTAAPAPGLNGDLVLAVKQTLDRAEPTVGPKSLSCNDAQEILGTELLDPHAETC